MSGQTSSGVGPAIVIDYLELFVQVLSSREQISLFQILSHVTEHLSEQGKGFGTAMGQFPILFHPKNPCQYTDTRDRVNILVINNKAPAILFRFSMYY